MIATCFTSQYCGTQKESDLRSALMKLLIGVLVSFVVGVGCRYFDIPVPSPPVIPGALLVLAMTIGYSTTNTILNRRGELATTSPLCGGPTGSSVTDAKSEPY